MGSEGTHTAYVTSLCTSAVSMFIMCNSVCGSFSVTVLDTGDGFDAMSYMLGLSNLVGKKNVG